MQTSQVCSTSLKGSRRRRITCASALVVAFALAAPATSSATFSPASGGEPAVTNTPTNSHFFNWNADRGHQRFCINVYRNGSFYAYRGCLPSETLYYTSGSSGTFSQTENSLPHGTFVGAHVSEYFDDAGTAIIYPCSFNCSSSTLIDLSKPQLTVYAAGTANYTSNPQIPLHIDYFDDLSHPWFAGGNNAAVYICQSRTGACTGHTYVPQCSVVNATRFSSPGTNKSNSFDCMYDFTSEPDGLVALCARAADQSIPDPDPTANEGMGIFPTHVNQFINPATGSGWTADKANISDSSCGSVILDRGPPTINATASDTSPGTGDLVTFSASGSDGLSGISGPYTWDFGDNTQNKQGANITHTYTSPGTYNVTLTGHDGAGNEGTDNLTIVVRTEGGTGEEGTVVNKPPSNNTIGGGEGTQKATVGSLKVVAPKKYRILRKRRPIQLALIASKPGAFQAALTRGPKVLSKGAGVLPRAGTFGFKLRVPKRGVRPGLHKLRITYVPDGATSGATKTLTIRFFKPRARGRAVTRAVAGPEGPVNVDAGPPLAPGYGT